MRHFAIILSLLLAVCLVASSPMDFERLGNRPGIVTKLTRDTRADQGVKGRPPGTNTHSTIPYPGLRKGEYICGNKVCKLRPGDKPPCPYCQVPI